MASDSVDRNLGNSVSAWSKEDRHVPLKPSHPQRVTTVDDIPTIPDVDDLADSVSKSLSVEKSSKTTTYKELDSELLKQYSFTSLDGVNMSPLLKFIHPDVHVKEPDTIWTIDSLFADLAEYYKEEKK